MDTIGVNVGNKKTKGIKPYLPNGIISNILCRLPAKNVIHCRLVCKGWRDLTLTRDFVNSHIRHGVPMIMAANYRRFSLKFLDKWWEFRQMNLMIQRFRFDIVMKVANAAIFSHGGLLVFQFMKELYLSVVIIFNPINLEKVTIFVSEEVVVSEIYGVFFHPSIREYCTLWRIKPWDRTKPVEYKMLILGSNPSMKTLCNPFSHRSMKLDSHPLFIDKYLYWMVYTEQNQIPGHSDVVQFDIISEEFSVIPCPIPLDTSSCPCLYTHLLNIDGALCFLVILLNKFTIWRLKDLAKRLWVTADYIFKSEGFEFIPRPIAVVDGNLALMSDRTLVVYNLKQGTTKCLRKKKYDESVLFLSHHMSLASLRNCPSTIYIDDEGEVDVILDNSLTTCISTPRVENFEIGSIGEEDEDEIALEL